MAVVPGEQLVLGKAETGSHVVEAAHVSVKFHVHFHRKCQAFDF